MKSSTYTSVIFTIILAIILSAANPLHLENTSFKVFGNCSMCKERIEKSVQKDGVVKAEWNIETKTLSLVYNPHTVQIQKIMEWIVASGHDTDTLKASNEVYSNLPKCCKYRKKADKKKK